MRLAFRRCRARWGCALGRRVRQRAARGCCPAAPALVPRAVWRPAHCAPPTPLPSPLHELDCEGALVGNGYLVPARRRGRAGGRCGTGSYNDQHMLMCSPRPGSTCCSSRHRPRHLPEEEDGRDSRGPALARHKEGAAGDADAIRHCVAYGDCRGVEVRLPAGRGGQRRRRGRRRAQLVQPVPQPRRVLQRRGGAGVPPAS